MISEPLLDWRAVQVTERRLGQFLAMELLRLESTVSVVTEAQAVRPGWLRRGPGRQMNYVVHCQVSTCVVLGGLMGCPSFNGDGGGNEGFAGDCIDEVNGVADWTLTGRGQDLVIRERVDGGRGTLTLRKFGN